MATETRTATVGGRVPAGPRRRPRVEWRIEAEGPLFAAYRGPRRVAWGLRSRAAAERWIVRLGGTPPLDTAPASDERPRLRPGHRIWWGEAGEDAG
jgi:hypothetical protein